MRISDLSSYVAASKEVTEAVTTSEVCSASPTVKLRAHSTVCECEFSTGNSTAKTNVY